MNISLGTLLEMSGVSLDDVNPRACAQRGGALGSASAVDCAGALPLSLIFPRTPETWRLSSPTTNGKRSNGALRLSYLSYLSYLTLWGHIPPAHELVSCPASSTYVGSEGAPGRACIKVVPWEVLVAGKICVTCPWLKSIQLLRARLGYAVPHIAGGVGCPEEPALARVPTHPTNLMGRLDVWLW